MTSISGTLQLSAGDLSNMAALPQQLEALVGTAHQNLTSIASGDASGNAISKLLANLNGLGGQAANLPDLGPLLEPIHSLVNDLPASDLVNLQSLSRGVDQMLGILGPAKDLIVGGKLDGTLQDGAQRAVEAISGLLRPSDAGADIFGQLQQFFEMFQSLNSWRTRPPSPQALVELLSQLLLGSSTDFLAQPYTLLRATLDPLRNVLPVGPDLSAWQAAFAARVNFWTELNAQLTAVSINWNDVEAKLQAELRGLIALRATRDRLISASLSNLTSINFSALDQVGAAIVNVPPLSQFQLSTITDGIRSHLESLASSLESWDPTPEQLRAMVNGLNGSFRKFLEESPLGELRAVLLRFHHQLMLAIESLPFRDLAAKVEAALRKVADAINVVDPDLIRKPIQQFFELVDSKIKELPVSEILAAVNAVWQSVNNVFEQINTQLQNLKNTLQGLVANVQTLVQQIEPTLDSIKGAVDSIDAQLATFDLKDASQQIVEQLHQLRDTVAGIDFSSVPDVALTALHEGAQFLRSLDVAGAINPSLSEALDKVDPTPQLESVTATLSAATGQLKAIDPLSVIKQLDKPVDDLLKALGEFGPDKFRSLLDAAVHPVEEALRQIDFTTALAPVTRVYADLFARVDAVLNPELIFGPLNELAQPVVNVIDTIQPGRLLKFAMSQAGPMTEAVGSSGKPPAAISSGSQILGGIPQAPELNDELFGFRPGDMLLPVIDLYRQFMQVIDGLSDDVMSHAADLFRDLFSVRVQSLFPSAIQLEVSGSLDAVIAEFEAGSVNLRLLESANLFQTFVATFSEKSASVGTADAAVTLRIGNLLSQLDPFGLSPAPSQSDAVAAACAQVQARVKLDGVQNAAFHLSQVRSTLPAFLGSAEVTVASFRKFLKDLDPAPVRTAINEAFDRISARIVTLQNSLATGIGELLSLFEEFLLPVTPAALLDLANRLHEALKEQLLAFHPNTFKDEVKLIFDIVKEQLKAFDPSVIVEELNKQRDLLIKSLHDFIAQLQPDPTQFLALQQSLAGLKPGEILKPAIDALKPVTELLGKIDIKIVLEPLIAAIERVKAQVPEVVGEIEAALDEVLNAIPAGGASSVSGSVSVAA